MENLKIFDRIIHWIIAQNSPKKYRERKIFREKTLKIGMISNSVKSLNKTTEAHRARLTHFTRIKTFVFFLWHCSHWYIKQTQGSSKDLHRIQFCLWFSIEKKPHNSRLEIDLRSHHPKYLIVSDTQTTTTTTKISTRPTCLICFSSNVQSVWCLFLFTSPDHRRHHHQWRKY